MLFLKFMIEIHLIRRINGQFEILKTILASPFGHWRKKTNQSCTTAQGIGLQFEWFWQSLCPIDGNLPHSCNRSWAIWKLLNHWWIGSQQAPLNLSLNNYNLFKWSSLTCINSNRPTSVQAKHLILHWGVDRLFGFWALLCHPESFAPCKTVSCVVQPMIATTPFRNPFRWFSSARNHFIHFATFPGTDPLT
jgi:hypothetical protein